jgi:phosphatidylinositol-bisphosphatase
MRNNRVSFAIRSSNVQEYDDGRACDPQAIKYITQQWVDSRMKERESQFTEKATARVFIGTWNVNAKKQDGGLHEWLLPQGEDVADLYAVGFQEIVDLNAMNVALDSSKTYARSQFWHAQIMECLGSAGTFIPVMQKSLVGILLIVYAKENIAPHIQDVRSASAGVGLMGMMGNKGGVTIRMNIHDTPICFVCSHLAAQRENVEGRNSDFKNIIERTVLESFSKGEVEDDEVEEETGSTLVASQRPRHGLAHTQHIDLKILDHEIVFWLGDLNYRITKDLTTEQVNERVDAFDIPYLRTYDQLNIERANGNVFHGFKEGLVEFMPTYKFQPGTDKYERREGKKVRAPAWCDRVLWREQIENSVRQLTYGCAKLIPSDHHPVSSAFDVDLRITIEKKEQDVYSELVNTLEFWRNTNRPQADVSGLTIDLDEVCYDVKSTYPVTITNTGTTLLPWHFVNKLEESKICKRWVSVDKISGLLLPNESMEIKVTVLIDNKTAHALNQGKDTLGDLLVLRLENCKDYYVVLSGSYARSCYGMALEELVTTMESVRSTKLPALVSADAEDVPSIRKSAAVPKLSIPKEVWRLVDALWSGDAVRERDLFQMDADPEEVAGIRESLDCNKDFPDCSPHAICAALITLVASLPKPLLPPDLYPQTEVEQGFMWAWVKRFLESLPPLNYNLFVYLISFFREVVEQAGYNRSSPAQIAAVCVGCMTPSAEDMDISREERGMRMMRQRLLQPVLVYLLTTKAIYK